MLRAALRLCRGDLDRAQDLVQDALVRAYQAYLDGRFREGTNARAWLLRILTNAFLNEYRQQRRHGERVDLETVTGGGEGGPEALQASPGDIPGRALLDGTLDEALERALAALSPDQRLCVVLVDIEELDYVQAAAALRIPVGTVRSRLSRARLRLQGLLASYGREQRLIEG